MSAVSLLLKCPLLCCHVMPRDVQSLSSAGTRTGCSWELGGAVTVCCPQVNLRQTSTIIYTFQLLLIFLNLYSVVVVCNCSCFILMYCRCTGDLGCNTQSCWKIYLFCPQFSWSGLQTRDSYCARLDPEVLVKSSNE